ncbi:MAG TPA: beta-galactosidase, partial [candidate division Zixibacteria bacterium]|nr:beta-galactosidase [candidate division Zixibacteria bacterium]
ALFGQLENAGLPKYLQADPKVLARNSDGLEVKMPADSGVDTGFLPSYLHSNFQYFLRSYFKAFIEVSKNYVHPRGPIFMVELDYETSFGRLLDPASADYNPDVVGSYYPQFLKERYQDIKKLNSLYKEKHKDFTTVEPPKIFKELDSKQYPKALDWFRFREYTLNLYLQILEEMFTSYSVEPLIFRSLYFRPGDLLPAFNLVPGDRDPFLGANVFPEGNYFDLAVKARFLKAEYGFAFASSFVCGSSTRGGKSIVQTAQFTPQHQRFYLAAGMAAGFKGMNQYMFVDRDHWAGAPLHSDGTISDNFPILKRFIHAVTSIGIEEMESSNDVAVLGNRLYSWIRLTQGKKIFEYVPKLIDESTVGFCRDLMRLKVGFSVRENRNFETLKNYRLVFVPTTEVMAQKDQEALVELSKAGTSIVLCGVMPKYDENFKGCQILANCFRIKASVENRIGTVTHKQGEYPTQLYASIRAAEDAKTRKLVKCGPKVVGVCSSRFKGNLYYFSFDIASGGNHHKLTFIESILADEKINPHLYCSDPAVDVSFQLGNKKGLLYVIAPPPGELSDGFEAPEKEIIIKADLKELGFKPAKIKMTNLFDSEETAPIKTSGRELREGISLKMNFPDGAMFLVEKR